MFSLGCSMALAEKPWSSDNDWKLVFSDDFSGPSLNTGNWSRIAYVDWPSPPDWRRYQSEDKPLVQFGKKDGATVMALWGRYGNYTTQVNQKEAKPTYACGGIDSMNTFSFQYGYVEVRAKFDCVKGTWPAIWMLPKNGGGWPDGGEIDIMEHLNFEDGVHQTIHYAGNNGKATSQTKNTPFNRNDWHTYGVEWTKDNITFYLDGKATKSMNNNSSNWPFGKEGHEFYLIIDQQIGGKWVESAGPIDQETLKKKGAAMYIDYVKVYSSEKYKHRPSKAAKPKAKAAAR
ncbi:glycoside hydrolase family 16 protein [Akkermansia glycaniphila]|uniref:glycoside hydrolase family 16 protein n=1 Tax=Akkermansia glycaniphila TaxID=1679444 RepID=UPI001C022EDC|nr:glycoside hydrolase family 16 protein [Akkermansia glycaniphila]MBT9448789.1 glycoside hydrolase family 16 protein [Akkermansia glycaniphila]